MRERGIFEKERQRELERHRELGNYYLFDEEGQGDIQFKEAEAVSIFTLLKDPQVGWCVC